MELVNIVLAAVLAFAAGAVWYMSLAEPWKQASGVALDADGNPEGGGMKPGVMVLTFVMQVVVAGMMRHVFAASGIETLGGGLLSGLGIGLFLISPWIALNNANSLRPFKLTLIDGGYATLACGLMGLVLTLF
ncbi:DUF1761 domain-containing protein [Mameliella sediminis]|uniref:DUF1761 domain-containing protein n=1 Tax=Mameliella sediminis TaxID=2836866 RepID=UPI001C4799DC|nr:DUF1761 domain-containing protein [Mameliella sediminis]MBV7395243.1 DUF1761 domain-containing protein [Mameliella sediminis]MBY6113946.1 DUF1761 domain-containing protein [Antarctobacter heliothermus]MBY6142706.1 DUF1761 domain-containing protein [Mameliella alba]MCA0953569.1 DUF1761 domain-containing protein [Mameliella alba]